VGKSYSINLDWFGLTERFVPGSTSTASLEENKDRSWVSARITLEQYFRSGFYSSGYYIDGSFSNQPVFSNYQGTIINAPSFSPMQDSKTLLLKNFRAFNYVSGGWRNVFKLRSNLDLRVEGYMFKPLEAIIPGLNQEAALSSEFKRIHFAGTAGLVLHSTVGPVSLSFNYYDDKENQLGALLHVGYLLFNKSSLE
jgi:NTE family protein